MPTKINREKLLNHYRGGHPIDLISYALHLSHSEILKELNRWKEDSKEKRTYTKEFKQIIADRDRNGISRTEISNELGMNGNSILNICKKYGQGKKPKAKKESTELYSFLQEGTLQEECPKCQYSLNEIEKEYQIYYCKHCGNEFQQVGSAIHQLNWAYID